MSLENAILEIIKEELYKIYYEADEELRTKYYKFSKKDNIDIDSFAEKLCKMQSLFSASWISMYVEVIRIKCNLIVSLQDEAIFNYAAQKHISFSEAFKKLCRITAINEFIKQYDMKTHS